MGEVRDEATSSRKGETKEKEQKGTRTEGRWKGEKGRGTKGKKDGRLNDPAEEQASKECRKRKNTRAR